MSGVDLPILAFQHQDAWDAWLAAHGGASRGLWLKFAKAGAPTPTVSKALAIETAIRHGWIDGQLGRLDEHYFLTRFTRRRPASRWSAVNRETAERLIAAGAMTAAGLREVEAAKADGRWASAYPSQGRAAPPPDLVAALAANPAAQALFDELDSANRYAVIYRVQDARRPETRARRIETFVAMLARGETLHPRRKAARARPAPS